MAPSPYVIRIDPWAAEYDGALQLREDQEPASIDARVETARWEAMPPGPAGERIRLAFVDGVRRVERRLLVERDGRTFFGLLGSFGVGAAIVDDRARVAEPAIGRVAVTGGGALIEPFRATVGSSREPLVFEPRSQPGEEPTAPLDGLQAAMREGEGRLTERLSAQVDVVVQDGPLSFVSAAAPGAVMGLVKRLQRNYLEPAQHALLGRLETGQRTPVFLIGGKEPRFSWYLRIARGRPIESTLTGIVRLETRAEAGLGEARRLADLSGRELPRFASDGVRDPRAPQNLYPVGGLEARLKHLLGDPLVVRRAIEARIHSEVTA